MRQCLGVLAFRTHLRSCYDFAFVPGARQASFAARLGFRTHEIIEGHLACSSRFAACEASTEARSFLFAGRFVESKGVRTLVEAWERYTKGVRDPWTLTVCGSGPLAHLLDGLPSTTNLGFVQPAELPAIMNKTTALVLPSLFEPWGVVIQEAAQAGLGLLATSACGAADYFLRDSLNGRLLAPGDPWALSDAFAWFHAKDKAGLQRIGDVSLMLAAQRSPESWAAAASRALGANR
jgi:glycosyltransferase involved in cell wall biosynthesis